MRRLVVEAVTGIGEVRPGDDLAEAVSARAALRDGDILVVTSKVVSKAEGRVRRADSREALLGEETDRVVARRGPTSVVRTWHGLVMAAAGIDASNTEAGTVVLLPRDPDAAAQGIRIRLAERHGVNVGVVVSDTSGRAWRTGQTDIAIGAAGLVVLDDHAGRRDAHGNELAVTAPAVGDELAAAGDLVKGKLGGTPVALVRGLDHLVLPPGEHGTGAGALLRAESDDMFGLGAREAVVSALGGGDLRGFGASAGPDDVADAVRRVLPGCTAEVYAEADPRLVVVAGDPSPERAKTLLRALGRAFGWVLVDGPAGNRAEPVADGAWTLRPDPSAAGSGHP